jgi:hypothetical protein
MTEAEWLACVEPLPMLRYLARRASGRKFRLFAQACWQRLAHLLTDERLRDYVLVLEGHADGLVGATELAGARAAARTAHRQLTAASGHNTREAGVSRSLLKWGRYRKAETVARNASWAGCEAAWAGDWAVAAEKKAQCDLLRDIVGNPFRPSAVDPSWAVWNDGLVVKLAAAAYEERAFDRLPVLADALEEAGCTDAVLLDRLRGPGPHALGCHALDAVLGKT